MTSTYKNSVPLVVEALYSDMDTDFAYYQTDGQSKAELGESSFNQSFSSMHNVKDNIIDVTQDLRIAINKIHSATRTRNLNVSDDGSVLNIRQLFGGVDP